ncbi:HEPN domain-containing protein [Pedobacter hiemivivus]|uniref:HEPN domain-containing protein n=1 Tax=Pedobacter hiemivivus TaxID=2530454 RepID=A0A4R0N9U6_9SPHI|nr:HEPN domain-containing protein [Pedobacter hiemivivus]TCC95024.1 HEPN domain-containing protein [Pedobacter hiemivivus]
MKKQNFKKTFTAASDDDRNNELRLITAKILEKYLFDKIICIGSKIHTQGEKISCFLAENGTTILPSELNNYYLMLIPSKNEPCPDIQIQQRLEEEFKSSASLTIIVHRMSEFNTALNNGSSFFTSVFKKGFVLHDNNEEIFSKPEGGKSLNFRITKKEAFWTHWHKLSMSFLKGGKFFIDNNENSVAVFMLHQALQHCYSGMLRVLTGYRTNSNSLRRLIKLIDIALPDSSFVQPYKGTPEESRLSSLLLKGFSDARYDETFLASTDDLIAMMIKISRIIDFANSICIQRLENLKSGKTPYLA